MQFERAKIAFELVFHALFFSVTVFDVLRPENRVLAAFSRVGHQRHDFSISDLVAVLRKVSVVFDPHVRVYGRIAQVLFIAAALEVSSPGRVSDAPVLSWASDLFVGRSTSI